MRTLSLAGLTLLSVVASADDLPSLQRTLQAASCGQSSGGDAASADAKTCKAVKTAYCSEMADGSCDSGGRRGMGKPVKVEGSDSPSITTSVNKQMGPFARAADQGSRCCGADSGSCASLFPTASPDADTANKAITAAVNANNNTSTTGSGGDSGGLKNKCTTYHAQADNAATVSASVAGMCKAYKQICVDGFKELARQIRAKQITGDRANIDNLAATMDERATSCESFSAETATTSAQTMIANAAQAQGCEANTNDGVTPSSTGDGKKDPEKAADNTKGKGKEKDSGMGDMAGIMGMANQLMQQMNKKDDDSDSNSDQQTAQADCSNPATAGCTQAAAATGWTSALGSGVGTGSGNTGGKFDIASPGPITANGFTPSNPGQGSPISVASVPGGGGGGIGGMGGGGGGGGAMGGGGGGGGGGGAKANTDIMHGEGGGGGGLAAMNAGMSTAAASGGGGFTYNKNAKPEAEPVDWRQFLPGGAKDPTRKLAGATPARVEIQPASTNIFSRVSERIRSRCAAGLLRDCN